MLKQTLYIVILLCANLVSAAEIGRLESQFSDYDNTKYLDQKKVEASITSFQYVSTSKTDDAAEQKGQLEINVSKDSLFQYKFNGVVGSYSAPKSAFFALPEVYVGYGEKSTDEAAALYIGRKIQSFSFADRNLNLGLYNPYFSNDLIQYKQQGLIGIHSDIRKDDFGLKLSYIPLYAPNQGPQAYAEDGQIKTTNRWAKKPPAQFSYSNQTHDIVYTIRDYQIKDIMSNGGSAVSLYYGDNEQRPVVQASVARKPISEIPLSRDTYATAEDFLGQVKLSPVVVYSQTSSVDINLDSSWLKTSLSYIEDRPENKIAAENETMQFLEPMQIYSLWVATDFSDLFRKTFTFEVTYSEITGGEIKDLMTDGSASFFTFSSQRTLFRKPFSVAVKSDLFFVNRKPILTTLKWTYDSAFKGSLLSGSMNYEAIRQLNVNVGFDILGVQTASQDESNFLKDNQANDRIYAGLQYAF